MTSGWEENTTPEPAEGEVSVAGEDSEEWHSHETAGSNYVHAHDGGHISHLGFKGEAYGGPAEKPSDEELGRNAD